MNNPLDPHAATETAQLRDALVRAQSDLRRIALALLRESVPASQRAEAVDRLRDLPAEQVVRSLASDQVDQLWLEAAVAGELVERIPAGIVETLKARRRAVAVAAFRQEHVLGKATALLDEIGVEHVVFKGALVRQLLYAKPHLRPAVDADLLVAPARAPEAVRALQARGFEPTLASHSDTHEACLTWHEVQLDLHWSLLRPGRMRVDLTDEILATRVREGQLWRPDDAHLTLAMLVHPAITDHVTGRLISAVDLDRWLRSRPVPWPAVLGILDRIGLRTAAWAMLYWTHGLLETPVPEDVWRALAPSPLRRRYLEAWLRQDPARLYGQRPNLVRGAFSLALQDRVSDVARALWRLARKHRLSLAQT
jgi:hypothetical protein